MMCSYTGMHNVIVLSIVVLHCTNHPILRLTLGQSTDFQGPGYFTCPKTDYEQQECSTLGLDPTMCSTEALQSSPCQNFTSVIPTFDDSLTTIIVSLPCECVVALGCAATCSFTPTTTNATTTPPPTTTVTTTTNYTGVGAVTCPYTDYFGTISMGTCRPSIKDNDLTLCGSCDATILDPTFGYQNGDDSITIPLPCQCLMVTFCPSSCNYTAGITTIAPTPAAMMDDDDETPRPTPVIVTAAPVVPDDNNETTATTATPVVATRNVTTLPTIATTSAAHGPWDCSTLRCGTSLWVTALIMVLGCP